MTTKDIDLKGFLELRGVSGKIGDVSDGYHSFDELYKHRMMLFACLVRISEYAFKSKLHDDGTMFDDYFIVWIETKKGIASYHYHIDHWDMFKCLEVERAPKFDGHTPDDTLERLYHHFDTYWYGGF